MRKAFGWEKTALIALTVMTVASGHSACLAQQHSVAPSSGAGALYDEGLRLRSNTASQADAAFGLDRLEAAARLGYEAAAIAAATTHFMGDRTEPDGERALALLA